MRNNFFPVSTVVQRRVERREAEQNRPDRTPIVTRTSFASSNYQDPLEEIESVESENLEPKSNLRRFRDACGQLVNNNAVQGFIILLIFVNAVLMGVATFNFVSEDEVLSRAFEVTDFVFLIIFTIELSLQFIYHGIYLFRDGWLVFDFVIILLSWAFSDVQIIRAFRIFRAVRLVGRIKIMRSLVGSVISVLPKMAAITVLFSLITYIFSVMFTTLFRDTADITSWDYFVNLQASAFTLFQIMTLDNWSEVCIEIQQMYTWAWAPFFIYIIISGFIVYNLVIGVVCEAVASEHEKEDNESSESQSEDDALAIRLDEQVVKMQQKVAELERSQEETQHMVNYMIRQIRVSNSQSDEKTVSSWTLSSNRDKVNSFQIDKL